MPGVGVAIVGLTQGGEGRVRSLWSYWAHVPGQARSWGLLSSAGCRYTEPVVAAAPLDKASELFGSMVEAVINCGFSPASGVGLLSTSEPPTRGLGRGGARPRFRLFGLRYRQTHVTQLLSFLHDTGLHLLAKGRHALPSRQQWLDGAVPLENGGLRRIVHSSRRFMGTDGYSQTLFTGIEWSSTCLVPRAIGLTCLGS